MPRIDDYADPVQYITQEYWTSGGSHSVLYSNARPYINVLQYNDPQSRPFPDDPLKSITGLPGQYTLKTNWGSTGRYVYRQPYGSVISGIFKEKRNIWTDWHAVFPQPPDTSDWITPLRLKIKNEAINLGTTVAEYRQSVNMFGSAARGIANAWRSFRNTRKGRKPLTMCSVAASELVYSYGIAPLLSDVYDSVEALRLRLEHPVYRRYHARSSGTNFTRWEGNPLDREGNYNFAGGYTGWAKCKQSVDIVAYVWFDLEKASLFTLGNPLEIAWELVPFSFVVDWMIPIGDALIALDALKAVDTMRVSISTKQTKEFRLYGFGKDYYGNAVRGPGARPMTYKLKYHTRSTNSTLPLPTIPKFSLSGSARRLLNAVSLLTAVRGCKGRNPRFSKRDFPGIRL